jgi:GrpB-like predicted nucleotidyltransferase (UPF0157 family)
MDHSKVSNMLRQEYQTSWPFEFEQLKNKILTPIKHLPVQLEHVGSTSVPGLAAKPIIDMDLVFQGQGAEAALTNPSMAEDYQTLKIAIAEAASQDRKQYALLKETKAIAFFDSIFLNADLDTPLK